MKQPKNGYLMRFFVEQKTGIEPAFLAWEANVLPLNYFCIFSYLISIAHYFANSKINLKNTLSFLLNQDR